MDPAEIEPPPEGPGAPRIGFGQAAIALKLVSQAQIDECINVQRAAQMKGDQVPMLGRLLQDRGYIDKEGIRKVHNYQQMYRIADRIPGYQLVERLGQGAMGTVYKAKQLRLDRWVAIKVLQPELAANPSIRQKFLQESRTSARLNHPNVITGIDAGEADGVIYFAMEYVQGKTLQRLVRERGPMDERQALEIILQIARALGHAERHGLVHRDVKPDNIMVGHDRVAKLLDLGLAKMRLDDDGTAKGMAVGTPNYISPEQAMGQQDIDTRSDIYSLGITFYYALTGRVPYDGPPEVVMYRHINEPLPHPKNYRPDLTDTAATLILQMSAKRREDRPATAESLAADIEHVLRTGKMPGLFDTNPGAVAPLRVARDSDRIGKIQRRRPRGTEYGLTPPPPTQRPGPGPGPSSDPGTRLPRKRRKRFDQGW